MSRKLPPTNDSKRINLILLKCPYYEKQEFFILRKVTKCLYNFTSFSSSVLMCLTLPNLQSLTTVFVLKNCACDDLNKDFFLVYVGYVSYVWIIMLIHILYV